jgi:osmotically-inducible protein OsmY
MNQLTIIENPENLGTITKVAMERLQASPYHILRRISCECKDGVLTLKGNLFSFHEKQIAQETVSSVEGAIQVVNEIEVENQALHT